MVSQVSRKEKELNMSDEVKKVSPIQEHLDTLERLRGKKNLAEANGNDVTSWTLAIKYQENLVNHRCWQYLHEKYHSAKKYRTARTDLLKEGQVLALEEVWNQPNLDVWYLLPKGALAVLKDTFIRHIEG